MASGESAVAQVPVGSKWREFEFRVPSRMVKTDEDLEKWFKSQAYDELLGFVHVLNEAVVGKKLTDTFPSYPGIDRLLELLDTLFEWIAETPAIEQPQRFGNKAFTKWWERLRDGAADLIKKVLPNEDFWGSVVELEVYLRQSFGNPTRIDYGTGHEFKFCAFLCCLMKLEVIPQEAAAPLALKVFSRYMELCRKLQTDYRMEPAGSHGVWGLDDFQFLPFIWGSSQFKGHPELAPSQFVEVGMDVKYCEENMFMACIKFIKEVKTGPFSEHSNTLWGISGVPEWNKVNSGLIKMFKKEVLGKFPVIQHFPFGTILSFEPHQ